MENILPIYPGSPSSAAAGPSKSGPLATARSGASSHPRPDLRLPLHCYRPPLRQPPSSLSCTRRSSPLRRLQSLTIRALSSTRPSSARARQVSASASASTSIAPENRQPNARRNQYEALFALLRRPHRADRHPRHRPHRRSIDTGGASRPRVQARATPRSPALAANVASNALPRVLAMPNSP